MTTASSRSRRIAATAVLPEAVGPNSPRTAGLEVGAGGLLEAMLDLARGARTDERTVLLRMRGAPLLEPRNRTWDAVTEGRHRLPPEQLARFANVGDVVRHLAEQRRCEGDLRVDVELLGDQLRRAHQGVPLAVGKVDRLVGDAAADERRHAPRDAVDAVVDVGEVEHLVLAAEDRDRLVARELVREERQYPFHPPQVVVVAPVDIREPEDQVVESIAAGVRVD